MNLEGITYRNEKGELKIQFVIHWLSSSPGGITITSREEVKEVIDKLLKI